MGRKAGALYINPKRFGSLQKPCMKEMISFLNCLALSQNNDDRCVRQKDLLSACMKAQVWFCCNSSLYSCSVATLWHVIFVLGDCCAERSKQKCFRKHQLSPSEAQQGKEIDSVLNSKLLISKSKGLNRGCNVRLSASYCAELLVVVIVIVIENTLGWSLERVLVVHWKCLIGFRIYFRNNFFVIGWLVYRIL